MRKRKKIEPTAIRFEHEINQKTGHHRIVVWRKRPQDDVENDDVRGEWTTYLGVALLEYGGARYFAVTAYYDGTFPIEKVMRYEVMS